MESFWGGVNRATLKIMPFYMIICSIGVIVVRVTKNPWISVLLGATLLYLVIWKYPEDNWVYKRNRPLWILILTYFIFLGVIWYPNLLALLT